MTGCMVDDDPHAARNQASPRLVKSTSRMVPFLTAVARSLAMSRIKVSQLGVCREYVGTSLTLRRYIEQHQN